MANSLAQKLMKYDLKLIGRDRFLIFMLIFIIYIIVVMRFGLPWFDNFLAINGYLPNDTISESLADFYPLIIAFFALFEGATITGTIFGFMLLDEKDTNTLKAILVSPVTLSNYIQYRITLASVATFGIVLAMVVFINQVQLPFWQLTLISLGASFTTPMVILFYAILAENKLQGFAYAKFISIAGWIIPIAWFVDSPYQWIFGLFPPFWISKAYWMASEENNLWWVALLIGILFQIGVIVFLKKRFAKVVNN